MDARPLDSRGGWGRGVLRRRGRSRGAQRRQEPSPLSRRLAPLFPPQPSLLDNFEYGMCGKVFRYDYDDENRVAIIASFGGLLMQLKGEVRHLLRIKMDDRIYALLRVSK